MLSRTLVVLLVCSISAAALAQPLNRTPAPGEYQTPQQTAANMTLPEGFKAHVFAGEPEIAQPIAMSVDERGRVWIIENYSYPNWKATGNDKVVILEDTDGDGVHDKRTVFWDKGNFATGLAVGYGGVWVGSPPNLLFIPDKNRDDKPDGEPIVLLDGWGHHDTHETLNTFTWGPDGWLYGCQGVFTHSKVGKPGTPNDKRVVINAAIWRYHPTKHVFERFAEGGSNQWGVDFNDHGHAFMTACVIPHLFHIVQGGRYHRQGGQHVNPHTYADLKTIRTHSHFAAAFAGATIYLGDQFPQRYRNQLFFNNIHASKVHVDLLEAKGSGYVGKLGPHDKALTGARKIAPHEARGTGFVNNADKWVRGLSLRLAPDGGLYLNDWYDQLPCHQLRPHDQTIGRKTGRVYKITYDDQKRGAKRQVDRFDLGTVPDADLIRLLSHANAYWSRTARRMLAERTANGKDMTATIADLRGLFAKADTTPLRLNALWALHVTNGLDEATRTRLLGHDDEHVRCWAIQLECEDRKAPEAALTKYAELAKNDPSPVVRLFLASALQRLPIEQRWPIAEALVAHGDDAKDHNLEIMYWYAIEPMVGADRARGLKLATKVAPELKRLRQFIARRAASN